ADADEHLDELRATEAEERHFGLAGDRTREERLAGARRSDEQDSLGDAAAEHGVLPPVPQELDDLLQLLLGLVYTSDVGKAHFDVVFGKDTMTASRKRHHAAFGAADPSREERPHRKDEQQQEQPHQQLGYPAADEFTGVPHTGGVQLLEQLRIFDACGTERGAAVDLALVLADDRLLADSDLGDLTSANGPLEIAIRDRFSARGEQPGLQQSQQQKRREDVPERSAASAHTEHTPVARTLVSRVHPRRCSHVSQ